MNPFRSNIFIFHRVGYNNSFNPGIKSGKSKLSDLTEHLSKAFYENQTQGKLFYVLFAALSTRH